ncbi:MAG: SGNH/GDSL hydrolase family protein, partial [Candidatus Binatia bacterium]
PTGSLYTQVDLAREPFRIRPRIDIVVPERYGDIRYSSNSAGYRDREWRAPGWPLVVLVGDSVAFGLGSAAEDRFPDRLESALRNAGFPRAEVRNLSMFGYGGYEELAALRQEGVPAHPDLVVVQFYLNDFHTPAPTMSLRHASLGQRLQAAKNRLLSASNVYLRLQQLVQGTAHWAFHDARRREPERLNASEPQQVVDLLALQPDDRELLAFQYLGEMNRTVKLTNARMLLLSTPNEAQLFFERWDEIDHRLTRFSEREGIPLVDSLATLRADPDRNHLFLDGVHLSAAGHAAVAELLAPQVAALLETSDRRVAAAEPARDAELAPRYQLSRESARR